MRMTYIFNKDLHRLTYYTNFLKFRFCKVNSCVMHYSFALMIDVTSFWSFARAILSRIFWLASIFVENKSVEQKVNSLTTYKKIGKKLHERPLTIFIFQFQNEHILVFFQNTENIETFHYFYPCTVFENHPKGCIWIFEFWQFPPIIILLKLTCLVTPFDRKHQVLKKLARMGHFWHF